jgi:peptide/nickel transport system substrate-binding protein
MLSKIEAAWMRFGSYHPSLSGIDVTTVPNGFKVNGFMDGEVMSRRLPGDWRCRAKLLLAAVLVGLMGGGCSPGTTQNSQRKTLIYSRGTDAITMDPIHADVGDTVKVFVNLYDTLVGYDDVTTDLVPSLATSWKTSDDGKEWTFQLREGVKFHDGTTLDSEAIVFSFERLIQPDHPHGQYEKAVPYRSSYANIEKVEAMGPLEVKFTLKEPSAIFLKNLAMFPASIVSPAAVVKQGAKYRENPAGTGPFKLSKWQQKQSVALAAFDDHWRGRPKIDFAVFLAVSESSTRVDQLKRGEAHIADELPPAELDALAKLPEIEIQEQVGMNVAYLAMQTSKPPLDNKKVRQAIALAIDKPELVRICYGGHAEPAVTIVPRAMWGAHLELEDRKVDVDAAKKLLAEGLEEAGVQAPLKITLSAMSQPRPYMQRPIDTATFIKDSLAKIGVVVAVETRDVNQHFQYVQEGKHQLCLAGWSSDNTDPDNFIYSLLDSDNIVVGNNLSHWKNERAHELTLAAQRELDDAKRLAMYHEIQEICFDEAPVVPLVHTVVRSAQRKSVTGYKLHPTNLIRLRLAELQN